MTYDKSTPFSRRALLAAAGLSLLAQPAAAADQPNYIVVELDDFRGPDWRAMPKTRRLLGGTMYRNYFTPNPLCAPSRASLLTGQHSHTHGVTSVVDTYDTMRDTGVLDRTLNVVLHDAGYRTGHFGKITNMYQTTEVPPGWDHFVALHQGSGGYTDFVVTDNGRRVSHKNQYSTNLFGGKAAAFVRFADAPFFCHFAPNAPHNPATPSRRYRKKFRTAKIQGVNAFREPDVSDKPLAVRNPASRKHGQQSRRYYIALERNRLRTLAAVDDAIEDLANAVKARGEWDNTYWFVVSDNGWMQGGHGWTWKMVPYDGSVRIPALVAGPGIESGTSDQFIANIDIAPTIAALTGTTLLAPADGENLFETTRQDMLVESFYPGIEYQGVRTATHLYVEWQTGVRELYDLIADPEERTNQLADWLGHTPTADPEVVAMLEQRLDELRGG